MIGFWLAMAALPAAIVLVAVVLAAVDREARRRGPASGPSRR